MMVTESPKPTAANSESKTQKQLQIWQRVAPEPKHIDASTPGMDACKGGAVAATPRGDRREGAGGVRKHSQAAEPVMMGAGSVVVEPQGGKYIGRRERW